MMLTSNVFLHSLFMWRIIRDIILHKGKEVHYVTYYRYKKI